MDIQQAPAARLAVRDSLLSWSVWASGGSSRFSDVMFALAAMLAAAYSLDLYTTNVLVPRAMEGMLGDDAAISSETLERVAGGILLLAHAFLVALGVANSPPRGSGVGSARLSTGVVLWGGVGALLSLLGMPIREGLEVGRDFPHYYGVLAIDGALLLLLFVAAARLLGARGDRRGRESAVLGAVVAGMGLGIFLGGVAFEVFFLVLGAACGLLTFLLFRNVLSRARTCLEFRADPNAVNVPQL